MKLACTYTSIWDDGIAITTDAILDTETFKIEIKDTDEDTSGLELLTGEEIVLNGKTIPIELDYDEVIEDYREDIIKAAA